MPFINTSEATKRVSARTENGSFQRSWTVEVMKASQPHFTLSLLTSLIASERPGFLEDTELEDKCFWVLFAVGEVAWNSQERHLKEDLNTLWRGDTHTSNLTLKELTWRVIFLKVGGMRFLKQCLQALLSMPAPFFFYQILLVLCPLFLIVPADESLE